MQLGMFDLPTKVDARKTNASRKTLPLYFPHRFLEACDDFAATSRSNAEVAKDLKDGVGVYNSKSFADSVSADDAAVRSSSLENISKLHALLSVEHLVSPRKKLALPGLKKRSTLATPKAPFTVRNSTESGRHGDLVLSNQMPPSVVYALIKENERLKCEILEYTKKDLGNRDFGKGDVAQESRAAMSLPLSQKPAEDECPSRITIDVSDESSSTDLCQQDDVTSNASHAPLSAKNIFASSILANSFRERIKFGANEGGRISDTIVTNLLVDSADKQVDSLLLSIMII